MAYGESLGKLNPCSDALIADLLRRALPDAHDLLDLACGRGERLAFLSGAFPKLRLSGIDADAENAAAAAERCPGAEITSGDAAALPYGDGAFAAVLCECSFSLFEKPRLCAAEISRVLCPGGVLLLGDLYAGRAPQAAERIAENGTVKNIYGRKTLEDFFADAGLRAEHFDERSGDLTQMLGQMLMDGVLCGCLGTDALMQMKRIGTGYGLWLFRR